MSATNEVSGMGYRELSRMEIVEVVRRWQMGESQRAIGRGSGVARVAAQAPPARLDHCGASVDSTAAGGGASAVEEPPHSPHQAETGVFLYSKRALEPDDLR